MNSSTQGGKTTYIGGNTVEAELSFYDYQRRWILALHELRVSRQQARRFRRTVEKKSSDEVQRVANEIHPTLSEAVREAQSLPNPKEGERWIANWVQLMGAVGGFIGGISTAFMAYQMMNNGASIEDIRAELKQEIIKDLQSQENNASTSSKSPDEKNGEDIEELEYIPPESTDI